MIWCCDFPIFVLLWLYDSWLGWCTDKLDADLSTLLSIRMWKVSFAGIPSLNLIYISYVLSIPARWVHSCIIIIRSHQASPNCQKLTSVWCIWLNQEFVNMQVLRIIRISNAKTLFGSFKVWVSYSILHASLSWVVVSVPANPYADLLSHRIISETPSLNNSCAYAVWNENMKAGPSGLLVIGLQDMLSRWACTFGCSPATWLGSRVILNRWTPPNRNSSLPKQKSM